MMIEPEDEERAMLESIAEHVSERVRSCGAEAIIGGSFAKDTWLSGTRDLDIFARFDARSEAELNERTRDLCKAFPEAEIVRGSRDYLRFETEGVTVEVVPIRPLSSDANTMDHSPDHITYVTSHLENTRDVRRLKALLHAHGIYGAEAHIRGFSGYVCELLVIAYGSLESLAQEARSWKRGVRVSFNTHTPFDDVLIVEDPTDDKRNAAAAVDEYSLGRFTALMERVASGNTFEELLTPEEHGPPYALVRMWASHEKRDVGFAQLRGVHERLERELAPFGMKQASWRTAGDVWESRFTLEHEELDAITTRKGPPVAYETAVRSFRAHHPNAYEERGTLYAPVQRSETTWEQVVRRVCTHPVVERYEPQVIR
ncbi:MAG: nucleotidyltransferase domain-containing protein [Candidatus Woesearchaeota archaeon]